MALSGHFCTALKCPLSGVKRTSWVRDLGPLGQDQGRCGLAVTPAANFHGSRLNLEDRVVYPTGWTTKAFTRYDAPQPVDCTPSGDRVEPDIGEGGLDKVWPTREAPKSNRAMIYPQCGGTPTCESLQGNFRTHLRSSGRRKHQSQKLRRPRSPRSVPKIKKTEKKVK